MNTKTNKRQYIEQNGCHNCEHCFIMYQYDDGPAYYCTVEDPNRPKCGSVAMKEMFDFKKNDNKYDCDDMDLWEKWSEDKEVKPYGTCDKWTFTPTE